MSKTNIFVTGGTGFIGKHFLEKLSNNKIDGIIYILSRNDIKFSDKRFKVIKGNLEQIHIFKKYILACDYIFHLGANANYYGAKEVYQEVNYKPTVTIVDILKESKRLKNLIYISTIGAVDRHKNDNCTNPININSIASPRSYYGKSKLMSENYIRESGIPYTIIRPTWVYGHNMRLNSHINVFIKMVLKKSIITKIKFPGKVSLIHVDDLSKSLENCLFNNDVINKTYFAETDFASIGYIFKLIKERLNIRKPGMISFPRMHFIIGKIHSFLPLNIANLFLDYLYALDPHFKKDFNITKPIIFDIGINDVIDNYYNNENGKWLITGANSGIGLSLTKLLDSRRISLILIDKEINNLKYFLHNQVIKIDLRNKNEIYNLKEIIDKEKIYCIVNNAGIGYRKSFKDLTVEEINNVINVNIFAPMLITKLLLPNVCKNKGTIVNIISSIAYNPLPHMSLYSASKAFLLNWSESLTYELKNICKVITISPSGTATNFQKASGVKQATNTKGLLKPEHVANIILNGVEKSKTIIIIGIKTKILLFISKFLPRTFNITFWGKMFEKMR